LLFLALLPASFAVAASGVSPAGAAFASTATPALNLPYDGTDPQADGCAKTAVTVVTVPLYNGPEFVGNLSLRWSTACKTNWGRFTTSINVGAPVQVYVYREADSKFCGDQISSGD
jgi:hypothetical protein